MGTRFLILQGYLNSVGIRNGHIKRTPFRWILKSIIQPDTPGHGVLLKFWGRLCKGSSVQIDKTGSIGHVPSIFVRRLEHLHLAFSEA